MELQGHPFTWERGHGTDKWVEIRLDRALVSKSWLENFKEAKLTNLKVSTSDHSPILLEPFTVRSLPRSRRLKFENAWLREPVCRNIVEDSWRQSQYEALQTKIKRCLEDVSRWGQEFTGNFKKRISQCKRVIKQTRSSRDAEAL